MRYQLKLNKFYGDTVKSSHKSLKQAMRMAIKDSRLYVSDAEKPEITHDELRFVVQTGQIETYEK
jgi:hypothetical protein